VKVAVTGGSGFIGSHVVDHLAEAGHHVLVLDQQRPWREDVSWKRVDIADYDAVACALAGYDAVMHLGAMANVNDVAAAPLESVHLNVFGTAVVLEAARANALKHFVFASTVWVYEAASGTEVDEDTPLRLDGARHLYTAGKMAGELCVNAYSQLYNLPTAILRYGIPYGPRMREQLVIPIFLKKAMAGEPLTIAGDGKQYRNFVYVEDLARAHVRVLEERATGTFNLEGPQEIAIIDVAESINRRVPASAGVQRTEARAGDYQGRIVSRDRALAQLGWEPTTAFEDGLDTTLMWFADRWRPSQERA
jgi:UDP-glucose 4-epimerase